MTKIRNYPLDTVIQDTDTLIGTDEGNYGATKTFPVASLSAYINEQGPQGTVTSVSGTGTVSGITLSGTVTESGSLTLGGSLSLTSQEIINFLGYTPSSFAEPGIFSGGGTPTLATGVTSEEVRTLIGVDATENVVKNDSDTFTASDKVTQIVTLSQAEYDSIATPSASTLYIIV